MCDVGCREESLDLKNLGAMGEKLNNRTFEQ
jgi:hypothetical protein